MIMIKDQYYFRKLCVKLVKKKWTHVNHAWTPQLFTTLLRKSILISLICLSLKLGQHVLTISEINKIFFSARTA